MVGSRRQREAVHVHRVHEPNRKLLREGRVEMADGRVTSLKNRR